MNRRQTYLNRKRQPRRWPGTPEAGVVRGATTMDDFFFELPKMTPAQSIKFMLTLPWTMGDVSDEGATYDELEIETVLDYVRQIEARADAAEAEVARLAAKLNDCREELFEQQRDA